MQLQGAGLRSKLFPISECLVAGAGSNSLSLSAPQNPDVDPEEGSAAGELSLISFIPKIRQGETVQ